MDKNKQLKILLLLFAILIILMIVNLIFQAIRVNKSVASTSDSTPDVSDVTVEPVSEFDDNVEVIKLNRVHDLKNLFSKCIKKEIKVSDSSVEDTTPTPTDEPAIIPSFNSSTPSPTFEAENEWKYYLATSYSLNGSECGNKGAVLTDKKVVAMWQTDTAYAKSCVEPFRTWYQTHNGLDYGALPYGTKMEMRYWTGAEYKYLGEYQLLDTSYTTIYTLSEVAKLLSGDKAPLRFTYNWPSTNYKGTPSQFAGQRWGHISNWKAEYSNQVVGWMDVLDAGWGMVIVEIRVIEE